MSTRHSHLGKLGSKCWGHPVEDRQLPHPMMINLSLKGVRNRVTYPLVKVFLLTRNHKYLLTKFILFPCHMKYETWAPSSALTMDELKILSHPLQRCLKLFNHSIFPHQGHPTRSLHPPWTYTTYNLWNMGTIKCTDHGWIKDSKLSPPEMLKTL